MLFAHPPTQLVLTPEYREATVTRSTKISFYGAAILLSLGACAVAFAQTTANRVGKVVNESQTVTLYGNTHPLARSEFDQGAVDATTPMGRMVLQLEPSASQSAALEALNFNRICKVLNAKLFIVAIYQAVSLPSLQNQVHQVAKSLKRVIRPLL